MLQSRKIEQIIKGTATYDGDGVRLTRLVGQQLQSRLDPFLMLDSFNNNQAKDYIGGFPNHPHRGFETLTYLLEGRLRHSDNVGNHGILESGGIQWMCAGRGIIHSEMPEQRAGLLEGFQLWINLPANEKMQTPWYKDVQSREIPQYVSAEGILVRVIAGQCYDIDGVIQRPVTQPYFLDIHFAEDNSFCCSLPIQHNAFIYVYKGSVAVSGQYVEQNTLAVLSTSAHEKGVVIQANQGSRLLLVAGAPLHEPIVQHGPFVMNTQEEVIRAIVDFKAGRF